MGLARIRVSFEWPLCCQRREQSSIKQVRRAGFWPKEWDGVWVGVGPADVKPLDLSSGPAPHGPQNNVEIKSKTISTKPTTIRETTKGF